MDDITLKIIELASIGCTPDEIIAELDLIHTEDEFNQLYASVMKKGKLKYQVKLKRAQASQAEEDPSVLKWVSLQHLGDKSATIPTNQYDSMTREQLLEILHGKS